MKTVIISDFTGCDGGMLLMLAINEMLKSKAVSLAYKIIGGKDKYKSDLVKEAYSIYNRRAKDFRENASRKKFVGWARLYEWSVQRCLKEGEMEKLADFLDCLDDIVRVEYEAVEDAVKNFTDTIETDDREILRNAVMVYLLCSVCYGYYNSVYEVSNVCYRLCKDERNPEKDSYLLTPEYFMKVENCTYKCISMICDKQINLNAMSDVLIKFAEKLQKEDVIEKAALLSGKTIRRYNRVV